MMKGREKKREGLTDEGQVPPNNELFQLPPNVLIPDTPSQQTEVAVWDAVTQEISAWSNEVLVFGAAVAAGPWDVLVTYKKASYDYYWL